MIIGYTCQVCGLEQEHCDVPDRGPEDVGTWLQQAIALAALDHGRRAPMCEAQALDLMVPLHGSKRVGTPMVH